MRGKTAIFTCLVLLLAALGLAACAGGGAPEEEAQRLTMTAIKVPDPTIDRSGWPVIVAFGDSLTYGYGVPEELSYPSQLQAELDERGYRYRVVNAGVPGELSYHGLLRVDEVLQYRPRIVILEFGANDGMQGGSIRFMRANLSAMIHRLQQAGAVVVIAGMMAPPNYGEKYMKAFQQVYADLAEEYGAPLVPFFLEGVGGVPELNLSDGIHPTPEGYRRVVANLWPVLEPLLEKESEHIAPQA